LYTFRRRKYMKCVNCDNSAAYTVAEPGVNPVEYCNNCLPKHLQVRAKAGHFPLAKVEAEVKPASAKKAKATPVVEEPAVEEAPAQTEEA
jgi:hypothetical protein